MSQFLITNIFSLGYRCNTDAFTDKFLNIRKYSSPFSYMVIDIVTALNFIDSNFKEYTEKNMLIPSKPPYKFNRKLWNCQFIHKKSDMPNNSTDILDMKHVCIWNHHNLNDPKIIDSLQRRAKHLLKCIREKPVTTLLFYIEKMQEYHGDQMYFDTSVLRKYKCKFLILVPLLNFKSEAQIYYSDEQINVIYFNSNRELWGTDINSHPEQWANLSKIINNLYNFQIEDRLFD